MKTRFFALLAVVVTMFIAGMVDAHAQPNPTTDMRPAVCMGNSDTSQAFPNDDAAASQLATNKGMTTCRKMNNDGMQAICDLNGINFRECLSDNANVLVKHDPKQPKAWNVFRIYMSANDHADYVDVLTPKQGTVSGTLNGMDFTLTTVAQANGVTQVSYTIGKVQGGGKFDELDWVQAGDAVLQRL
jgi:hypothetical protein